MFIKKSAFFVMSLALLSSTSAFAQQAISDTAIDRATQSSSSYEDSPLQVRGQKGDMIDCPSVSYADLLSKPDNIDLNYCYAISKIKSGDYKSAVSTLERVLILAPYRYDVRMAYASALYKLGALNESKLELEKIKSRPLSDNSERAVDSFIAKIDKKQTTTRHAVTLSVGAHYDSNRNAAPENDTVLISGNPLLLTDDQNKEDDDIGIIGSVRYDIEHDFGALRQHTALASFTYYHDDQVTRDELDLGSFSASAGAKFDLGGAHLTALINHANLQLSKQKFFNSTGGNLRLDKSLHRGAYKAPIKLWGSLGYAHDEYGNISENSTLRERTGNRKEAKFGGSFFLAPKHNLTLEGAVTRKDAKVDFQAYHSYMGRIGHRWALNNGQYLLSNLNYGRRNYDGSDAFVTGDAGRDREEKPLSVNTNYIVPVAYALSKTDWMIEDIKAYQHPVFQNMNMSFMAEYFNQNSDISNYDYENIKGQFLVTKRIEF